MKGFSKDCRILINNFMCGGSVAIKDNDAATDTSKQKKMSKTR
jgi:hypothetical protein